MNFDRHSSEAALKDKPQPGKLHISASFARQLQLYGDDDDDDDGGDSADTLRDQTFSCEFALSLHLSLDEAPHYR